MERITLLRIIQESTKINGEKGLYQKNRARTRQTNGFERNTLTRPKIGMKHRE